VNGIGGPLWAKSSQAEVSIAAPSVGMGVADRSAVDDLHDLEER
jgi:hypothetical protein